MSKTWPYLVAAVLALGILLVVSQGSMRVDNFYSYFLSFLLILIGLAPMIWGRLRRKSFDCLEMIYIIAALYILYFGIRAVWVLSFPEDLYASHIWGTPPAFSLREINESLIFVIVGLGFLFVGYYSHVPRLLSRALPRPRLLSVSIESIKLSVITFIYSVSWLARLILISQKLNLFFKPDTLNITFLNILRLFGYLGLYAYALITLKLFSDRRAKRKLVFLFWTGVFSVEILYGFISGWKSELVFILLIPVFIYHYAVRRFRLKQLLVSGLLLVTITIFGVFPLIHEGRLLFYKGQEVGVSDIGRVISGLARNPWQEYQKISVTQFFNRAMGVDSLAIIIHYTPETFDFQRGRNMSFLFLAFIPRFIWPEKPVFDPNREFAQQYWGQPLDQPGGIVVTNIGDLYMNYGLAGIMVGMFILGVIYRLTYLYFIGSYQDTSKSPTLKIVFYVFTLFALFYIETSYVAVLTRLISIVFLLLVINLIFLGIRRFMYLATQPAS